MAGVGRPKGSKKRQPYTAEWRWRENERREATRRDAEAIEQAVEHGLAEGLTGWGDALADAREIVRSAAHEPHQAARTYLDGGPAYLHTFRCSNGHAQTASGRVPLTDILCAVLGSSDAPESLDYLAVVHEGAVVYSSVAYFGGPTSRLIADAAEDGCKLTKRALLSAPVVPLRPRSREAYEIATRRRPRAGGLAVEREVLSIATGDEALYAPRLAELRQKAPASEMLENILRHPLTLLSRHQRRAWSAALETSRR